MMLPGKREIKVTASDALEFEPVVRHKPDRRPGFRLFLLLVLAGAGAGAWYFYGDRLKGLLAGADAGIPLIKAEPGPVKVRPESPGGLRIPDRDKLVYDRMQGEGGPEERGAERLLPPPEQPLPKPTAANKPPQTETPAQAPPAAKPATPEKLVAKPEPQPQPKLKPIAKVPTIKDVQSAKRPAPPPPPPAPPAAPKSSSPVLSVLKRSSKKAPEKPSAETKTAAPKPAPAPNPALNPALNPTAPPAVKKAPVKAVSATPVPSSPPSTPLAAPETAQDKPAPAPIPKSKAYLVQLAAARSPQGARDEWKRLRSKHLDLLGNLGLSVTKADLGSARGVYYRLRAGPIADEIAARRLCRQLAERQIGCLIIKPVK